MIQFDCRRGISIVWVENLDIIVTFFWNPKVKSPIRLAFKHWASDNLECTPFDGLPFFIYGFSDTMNVSRLFDFIFNLIEEIPAALF
jgi:hypothetical protein